jgi:hypothetical protein
LVVVQVLLKRAARRKYWKKKVEIETSPSHNCKDFATFHSTFDK